MELNKAELTDEKINSNELLSENLYKAAALPVKQSVENFMNSALNTEKLSRNVSYSYCLKENFHSIIISTISSCVKLAEINFKNNSMKIYTYQYQNVHDISDEIEVVDTSIDAIIRDIESYERMLNWSQPRKYFEIYSQNWKKMLKLRDFNSKKILEDQLLNIEKILKSLDDKLSKQYKEKEVISNARVEIVKFANYMSNELQNSLELINTKRINIDNEEIMPLAVCMFTQGIMDNEINVNDIY